MNRRPARVILALVMVGLVVGASVSLLWYGDLAPVAPPPVVVVPLLVALLVAAVWLAGPSLRQRHARPAGAAKPEPLGPVAVPPDEFEEREGELTACLNCGSLDVRESTFSEGSIVGIGPLQWTCRRCGWQGQPLTFASPTDYRAFVKALHEGTSAP